MDSQETLKMEEYRALITEHRGNRAMIFERPLAILGLVGVATGYAYSTPIAHLVLTSLIFVVLFNLWFIGNRLQSDSRIVAYLQLVHEGELKEQWFGWESALREYRKWMSEHRQKGDLRRVRGKRVAFKDRSQEMRFYPSIWLFHVGMVLLALIASILKWMLDGTSWHTLGVSTTLVAALVFMVRALGPMRPGNFDAGIETERVTWQYAFEQAQRHGETSSGIALDATPRPSRRDMTKR